LALLLSTIVYAEAVETSSTTNENISDTEVLNDENTSTTTGTTTSETASTSDTVATTSESLLPSIQESHIPSLNNTTLSIVTQTRITNLCANISNRLDAVILRQENIANRLQTRVNKIKAQNINTNEAEEKLKLALTTIHQAKDIIKNIDHDIHQTVTATDPKNKWTNVYSTYLETDRLVKQAHVELKTVVYALKNSNVLVPEIIDTNATTSTSTKTNE
jgi:hypothetical protein